MIVPHSSRLPRKKIVLAFADTICVALAMFGAVMLRLGWADGLRYIATRPYAMGMAWSVFIIAFYIGGLYENDRLLRVGRAVTTAFISVAFASLVITAFFYATLSLEIGRGVFLGYAAFVFVAITTLRLFFIAATRHGFMAQRCLIIGTNVEARRAIELVHQHSHAGMRILGLIHCGADRDKVGKFCDGYPVLGTIDALEKFVDLYDIDRLVMSATLDEEPVLLRRLRPFRYRGLALIDLVALYEELAYEIPLELINDEWLFTASMNNSRIHIRRLKRFTDMLFALVGLALGALPLIIAALLIKLTSRGPVLYRQERLGRDSKPFTLLKLRTMQVDAESQTGPVWSTEDDPRITPVGRLLRKFRVDELPQLFNVLNGEMSLVGPRPEREVFIRKLSERIPFYSERLLVPPGITGWAQVMAPYAASIDDSRRKLQFDLYYIKHMSFFLDLLVFAKTAKTILFGREKKRPVKAAKSKAVELDTETVSFEHPPEAQPKSHAS